MNEIQIFKNSDFGEMRTVEIDGEAWFAGKDVASVLGYVKTTQAIHSNVDLDDSCTVGLLDARGIMQNTIVINESGLFSLILGSKLESAKKFKRWVTSEVLPALHHKGAYQMPSANTDPMKLLELQYEAIKFVDQKTDRNKQDIASIRNDFESFKLELPILGVEKEAIKSCMQKKVIKVSGGRKSNAYRDKSTRGRIYGEIQRRIREQLGIKRYDEIRAVESKSVISLITEYEPSDEVYDLICMYNAQMNIFVK